MKKLIVVRLDDSHRATHSYTGTVVRVLDGTVSDYLRSGLDADKDGARSDLIRLWSSYPGARVGDRVGLP